MASEEHLFSPITLRSVTIRNRLWIAPMCQYSVFEEDGFPTDWHLVHLGSRAVGGAGMIIIEASAVEPRGRISMRDIGMWDDRHAEAWQPINRFMEQHGAVPAIQLAHAGRKGRVTETTIAPSAIAFSNMPVPEEMTEETIQTVIGAFREGAKRSLAAGFRCAEIHSAHGYLLHQFLSPLSNQRTDRWGGSFENRTRMLCEVTTAVRDVWPEELPLIVRISATDWMPGGWDIDQSIEVSRVLKGLGVDLIDTSSGGLHPDQQIDLKPGYQVPFAARIRKEVGIATGAVGLISDPKMADQILRHGQADAILIARQSLRDPYWPIRAARALEVEMPVPAQYERGWTV